MSAKTGRWVLWRAPRCNGPWLGRWAAAWAALLFLAVPSQAADPVFLAFDGAYGIKTNTAPQAIERGIRAALEEINATGGVLGGRPLQLIISDNQGVSARARDNYLEHAARRDVIAVLGGKFSPVVVETVPEAQRAKVPLVSVWGSADPITDHGGMPSYVFRLSLKDSWGVQALMMRAVQSRKARRLCAVLPNTAWGRSADHVIQATSAKLGVTLAAIRSYNWGDTAFTETLQACLASHAQALILVANEKEAAVVFRDMAALPKAQQLPIVAHWGLTGGLIHQLAGDVLDQMDLQVIQTFTFVNNNRPAARRLAAWLLKDAGLASVAEIASPVGSAHAYDMTHLLARAVNQARSTQGDAIRRALENLPPYDGAVRRYAPAFTPTRHDALGPEQVLFVRVDRSGSLIPLP